MPPELATPDCSSDKLITPNPMPVMGRSVACFAEYVPAIWAVVASMAGAASVTVMADETACTCKVRFAEVVWFKSTETLLSCVVPKPGALAETSYMPGGRFEMRYSPAALLEAADFTFVALLVATINTLGTAAPLLSVMAPTRSPLITWPTENGCKKRPNKRTPMTRRNNTPGWQFRHTSIAK